MTEPRERETQELIEQVTARQHRRRWGRILLLALATAIVVAGLVAGVVLATAAPGDSAVQTASSQSAVASTTEGTMTTTISIDATGGSGTETTASSSSVSQPTGTQSSTPATPTASTPGPLAGVVIAIDPGHQAHADSALEPIGPGSSTKKAKVSSGTSSTLTGVPEGEVTLAVGLKLRDALTKLGATVVMTRTTQDVDVSNMQRAQIANQAAADLFVRLHCNGSGDRSVHGLFTLYPASITGWTDDIAASSKRAATVIQRDLIAATGATDRGLQERRDLTGFNWSDVPAILVEMGFMSNPTEDEQLRSDPYQDKLVQGLVQGISEFVTTG